MDDRKSMTRRVVKYKPYADEREPVYPHECPYGKIGDRLWVRETFRIDFMASELGKIKKSNINYKADKINYTKEWKWHPSIFMPRKYSRITLEITDIKVERVQDISQEDQIAEGIIIPSVWEVNGYKKTKFTAIWDNINYKRGYGWDNNPWVWVISFKMIKKEV